MVEEGLRQTVRSLVTDVAELKTKLALTMQGQKIHQERVQEFIAESKINYDDQNKKLDRLLKDNDNWAFAKKLVVSSASFVAVVAAVVSAYCVWITTHAKAMTH